MGSEAGMEQEEKTCKTCAYAMKRTNPIKFRWCEFECTAPVEEAGRHLAYKMASQSCEKYIKTNRPGDYVDD